jgi:thiamine biosynthesis lipoprotein ApbE
MRKLFILGIMLSSLLMLTACKSQEVYIFNFYDYMDTFITVSVSASSQSDADQYEEDIDAIFSMYHDLSTSYEALEEESEYLENIYSINQNIGQRLEIDQQLYDVISYAQEIKILTDNYFDISIGKAVDVWKHLMTEVTDGFEIGDSIFVYHYYDGDKSEDNKVVVNQTGTITSVQTDENNNDIVLNITLSINEQLLTLDKYDAYEKEVSNQSYQNALEDIEALDFTDHEIILENEDNKYFITIHGEDIKLDLGAISKGYATQKAYEYIIEQNIVYYSITSGSSSIVLGENKNRPDEDYIYKVSLANPVKTEVTDKATYGTISVKNLSVTTSGNYEQYVLHQGYRYHHIVSPFVLMPVQYYHTVTILGQDAGLLDALSTALFSMSPDDMETWLLEHQTTLGIELIIYNQDNTITTYLKDVVFEEH